MLAQDQTTYDTQVAAKKAKDEDEVLGPDGRPIPNAGVYGQEQANAELAWQNARTAASNKLKNFQNKAGVLADGSVDPRNTYGGYQQLLHQQGSELDSAQESAMGRGLGGGPGLGNQAERGLRFGHAVQNLGFQRGLSDAQANYGMELGEADLTRRNAMTAALQKALNNAWGDWTPPEVEEEGGGGGASGGATSKTPALKAYGSLAATSAAKNKKYKLGAYAPKKKVVAQDHQYQKQVAALNRAFKRK